MKIKPTVNLKKLISEMPRFFHERGAFITELVQNAYRAGATRINITVTPGSYTISDDGSGIPDPEVLLEVAGSSWENKVIKEQDPAGMGLFSALMRGDRAIITSCYGRNAFRVVTDKETLGSLGEIDVLPVEPAGNGTTVAVMGEFDVKETVESVKRRIVFYDTNASGEKMKITLQGEPLKQRDFLTENGHLDPAFIKTVSAGELALYENMPYSTKLSRRTQEVLFHGQEISGPISDNPYYRLRVKEMGLTPRLPDRTAFVDDERLTLFREEFSEAVREALLAGALNLTAGRVLKYLDDRTADMLPEEVVALVVDRDLPGNPANPWGTYGISDRLRIADDADWKGRDFDVIIADDYELYDYNTETPDAYILAALYYLEGVKVGLVNSSVVDASKHPDFVSRLHSMKDFEVTINEKEDEVLRFGSNCIKKAEITLKSGKLDKEWNIEGVVPKGDYGSLYSGVSYYWSLPESLRDFGSVINHLSDITVLVADVSDEDQREDPYGDDFIDAIENPLRDALCSDKNLISGITNMVTEAVANNFGYMNRPSFDSRLSISIKEGTLEFAEIADSRAKFRLENGNWYKEAAAA